MRFALPPQLFFVAAIACLTIAGRPSRSAAQVEDPFNDAVEAADPFGGDGGFGADDADPFGAPVEAPLDIKAFNEEEKERRQAKIDWHVSGALLRLQQTAVANGGAGDDRQTLDAALALLHYRAEAKHFDLQETADIFGVLAGHVWQASDAMESPAQRVRRILATKNSPEIDRGSSCGFGRSVAQCRAGYELLTTAPWPFDWQRKEARWIDIATCLFHAERLANPADAWRRQAAKQPELREFFAAAYVGTIEHSQCDRIDAELIEAFIAAPIRQGQGRESERLRRFARLLVSLECASAHLPQADVERYRADFAAEFATASEESLDDTIAELAQLCRHSFALREAIVGQFANCKTRTRFVVSRSPRG